MNDLYRINDDRPSDSFKKKTFSGFKKNEIINAVLKSIETKKIENACNWLTECLCSGYIEETWQKLLCFSSNIITSKIISLQLCSTQIDSTQIFSSKISITQISSYQLHSC